MHAFWSSLSMLNLSFKVIHYDDWLLICGWTMVWHSKNSFIPKYSLMRVRTTGESYKVALSPWYIWCSPSWLSITTHYTTQHHNSSAISDSSLNDSRSIFYPASLAYTSQTWSHSLPAPFLLSQLSHSLHQSKDKHQRPVFHSQTTWVVPTLQLLFHLMV